MTEQPPDGHGHWPTRFLVNQPWADDRSGSWRAVTNYPTMQSRRRDDLLDLRITGDPTVHTYRLSPEQQGVYLADRIDD